MRFTLPGLMPIETPSYSEHLESTVHLRGNVDKDLNVVVKDSAGDPVDLTDKTLLLLVTNEDNELVEIADAVTVNAPTDGDITVNFADDARAVVAVDDGVRGWMVAEVQGETKIPLVEGIIFRTELAQD